MRRHHLILLLVAACDRPETLEVQAQKAALADSRGACVQLLQRQRACTDSFIPALVDLRRQLDKPAGIAQTSREELIPQALEEWKSDSTDQAIASQCDRLATQSTPAQLTEGRRCVALAGCSEFVRCVMPLMREHLSR
jgi:hypothetical protein